MQNSATLKEILAERGMTLKEFAQEVGEKVKVVKVDVDINAELAMEYGVSSIPTLAVFKDGQIKEKSVGLATKANLSEMLIKYL